MAGVIVGNVGNKPSPTAHLNTSHVLYGAKNPVYGLESLQPMSTVLGMVHTNLGGRLPSPGTAGIAVFRPLHRRYGEACGTGQGKY